MQKSLIWTLNSEPETSDYFVDNILAKYDGFSYLIWLKFDISWFKNTPLTAYEKAFFKQTLFWANGE